MTHGDRARERLRWRCRRGMLELDLVLDAFVERHLDSLDADGVEAFKRLLGRTDPELLDLVMGRGEGDDAGERALLAFMRTEACSARSSTQHS